MDRSFLQVAWWVLLVPVGVCALSVNAETVFIRLPCGMFDPLAQPATGTVAVQGRLHLVQLAEPPDEAVRQELEAQGLSLVAYIPDWTYLVKGSSSVLARLREMVPLRWAGPLLAAYRLDPQLAGRTRECTAPLLAILSPGADPHEVAAQLNGLGCQVLGAQATLPRPRVFFLENETPLDAILALPDLLWLTEQAPLSLCNDNQRWVVQSNIPGQLPLWDRGLLGEGQIIGQIDHGPDLYHCLLLDPEGDPPGPNHRKFAAYFTPTSVGAHGTHTAGTAAGCLPDDSISHSGVARAARLASDDFRKLNGTNDASPGLYEMLLRLHNVGARIHTNSWGTGTNPNYGYYCVDVDTFCWDFETDVVLFAAGNSSVIADPAVSKNCIACGATYAPPNQDTILFGDGGPTADGRRKPDLFALGQVTSGLSAYCTMGMLQGTSMSTPGLAGGAALVRQYYLEGFHMAGRYAQSVGIMPSAALVKATMINSSVDMTGVSGWPTDPEGWGRVLLDNALHFEGEPGGLLVFDVWNAQGLNTGQSAEHVFLVPAGAGAVRLTLAFTDAPATYRAVPASVNNLDLSLTTPQGTIFRGNVFAGGQSVPGGTADPLNNVEQILLKSPTAGRYTARIVATAINWGRQGYALVITGDVQTAPDSTPTPVRPTNTPPPPTATWTPLRLCGAVISEGKRAVASGQYLGYGPERAVDGIVGVADSRWVSVGTTVHWLYVDLGQPYSLCQIHVYSDESYDPPNANNLMFNISKYTLHGSNTPSGDPSRWPLLGYYYDSCGPPFPDYPGEGAAAHNTHWVTGTYRYVGIHVTGGDGWCNDCRLQELRIFADSGQPGPTRTPTPAPTRSGRAAILVH